MSGWIKLHRSLLGWEWYSDHNTFLVFMHLLLKANYADSKYRGHDVPAGSLITGRITLAESLRISERSVRTALDHLKSSGEVTIKPHPKFSIITITKWKDYQQDDQQPTSNRPATDQQPTTSKEVKKERKKEIPPTPKGDFAALWDLWNPYEMVKGTRSKAESKYQASLELTTHEVLMDKAKAYCAQCQKLKTKTQHVATWLHQRGWETEYQPPPPEVPDWIRAQR